MLNQTHKNTPNKRNLRNLSFKQTPTYEVEVEGETPVPEAKMSTNSAAMGLTTVMVGAGILALPKVAATCGWLLAPLCVVGGGLVNRAAALTLVEAIERARGERVVCG